MSPHIAMRNILNAANIWIFFRINNGIFFECIARLMRPFDILNLLKAWIEWSFRSIESYLSQHDKKKSSKLDWTWFSTLSSTLNDDAV